MNSFLDRISLQRRILRAVSKRGLPGEKLHSLSREAINRWLVSNQLSNEDEFVRLVVAAADDLMFLTTRSQDQTSNEFQNRLHTLDTLIPAIESLGAIR